MFIFYDFETSSRELLGQILNYAFVITDLHLTPLSELTGYIRLNRTQLPEIEAILVNQLDVSWLQTHGKHEWEASEEIFQFLQSAISQYGPCCLAGFNSNQFDLGFLRNLLISYGYNPYFEGKLTNKDLLHFSQFLAFQDPTRFPWVRVQASEKTYYSFKLEDLSSAFGLLDSAQTHDAKDDVYLTISLAKALQDTFDMPFRSFVPFQIHVQHDSQLAYKIGYNKTRHFATQDEELTYFKQTPLLLLARDKKTALCVNLERYQSLTQEGYTLTDEQKLSCVQYVNENKHFFILNPLAQQSSGLFDGLAETIFKDSFFLNFSKHPALYFDAIKKPWDIAYQTHELGFDHIPQLRTVVSELLKDPNAYPARLKALLDKRKTPKDTYMIQLYNRAYMNCHPSPDTTLLNRYLEARYVSGKLLKDPSKLVPISEQLNIIEAQLNAPETTDKQISLLISLKHYFREFQTLFSANAPLSEA